MNRVCLLHCWKLGFPDLILFLISLPALDFELTSGGGGLLNENAHAWLSRWSEGRMLIGDGVSTNPEKYSFEPWQVLTKQEHHNSTESLQTYTLSSSSIEDESFSLARCLISAQFALLSNFPESPPDYLKIPSDSTVTKCAFFGLSPSGLGRGNTADDYMVRLPIHKTFSLISIQTMSFFI